MMQVFFAMGEWYTETGPVRRMAAAISEIMDAAPRLQR